MARVGRCTASHCEITLSIQRIWQQ